MVKTPDSITLKLQGRDRLDALLEMQRRLQIGSYGDDPRDLSGSERADFFRTMAFALNAELVEASEEIGWKPWAKGEKARYINREAYLKELVDAFHFFMNLWLLAGGTAEDLYEMYMAKRNVNERRQVEGYDGVSTKCHNPDCKRALDDYVGQTVTIEGVGTFHSIGCWDEYDDAE